MSWITVRMDLEDNQAEVDWIYLSKFVLSTIRGGQFLYISIKNGCRYSFDCYSAFSLNSPIPFSQGILFILYYLPPFISALHV